MARRRVVEEVATDESANDGTDRSEDSARHAAMRDAAVANGTRTTTRSAVERHTAKTVRVVWGAETFSPAKFHVCIVGPFELEAAVPEGEDPMPIIQRLRDNLQAMAEAERERKLKSFIPNVVKH
jgi:hypothetical protein